MNPINRTYMLWLIIIGLIEGTSTLILFFVAMPLKYYADQPMAVTICGSIHGLLFLGLVGMFIYGKAAVPLSWGLVWIGIFGAIVPFGPFLVDIKLANMLTQADNGHSPSG